MRERASAFDMTGRTALVTGASSGIGRAVALELIDAGARVALVALPDPALHETAEHCAAVGGEVVAVGADVSDGHAVDRAFAAAETLGPVDAVFSAAGTSTVVPAATTTDEVWHRQLQVNLTGTFNVVRVAARLMSARGSGCDRHHRLGAGADRAGRIRRLLGHQGRRAGDDPGPGRRAGAPRGEGERRVPGDD